MLSALEFSIKQISQNYSHVVEFGVYQGRTIRILRNNLSNYFSVFGFDTFTGLPEDWVGTQCKTGAFSTGGQIPVVDNVTMYDGLFKDTIPKYLEIAQPIALLHLDCDLYSSTKTVLEMIGHLLVKGTIICCDEWFYRSLDGTLKSDHEQRAVREWIDSANKNIHYFDFEDKTVNGFERKVLKIL